MTALKRLGRFVIPRDPVITSGRKIRTMGLGEALQLTRCFLTNGEAALQRREGPAVVGRAA